VLLLVLFYFPLYFCDDTPDDGHMAETYSMIMCIWAFDNKYTVVLDCCWLLTV
jgi:hypothetical protein